MAWILGTDVRDGERLALPAAASVVSFDIRTHQRLIEHAINSTRDQIACAENTARQLAGDDGVRQVRDQTKEALRVTDTLEKRASLVECVVRCSDTVYLLHSVKFSAAWDEVIAYTRREKT